MIASLSLLLAAGACGQGGFPDSDWTLQPPEAGAEQRAAMEEYLFTIEGEDHERRGIRTNGLLILREGQLIYERYARGFTAENPHLLWSATKSIFAAIVGVAVDQGLLDVRAGICEIDPSLPPHLCEVSVLDLLQFSSGIDFVESYEGETNQASSVLAMLYGVGSDDMAGFVAGHELRDAPGDTFAYSTGDAMLLSRVLGAAVRPTHGEDYPWPMLFEPLEITSATVEADKAGNFVGGSYAYMTPRDALRFGYFLLRNGCWKGSQILPHNWIDLSTRPNPAVAKKALCCGDDDISGRSLWLNIPVPETGQVAPWPDAPRDTYAASGHWGQFIFMVPSKELVVVRVGDDRDGSMDRNEMLKRILAWTEVLP